MQDGLSGHFFPIFDSFVVALFDLQRKQYFF